jgi:hypothetical protein
VPTALSSTDVPARPVSGRLGGDARWFRPVRDVGHLLWFRSTSVRRRAAFWWAAGVVLVLTLAVATVPGFVPATPDERLNVALLLPTAMAGLLLIAIVSAVASGGGRELISREQGVAYPVSPATDHLGALLLAPLNIAWLLQAWTLLGATAYVAGAGFGLVLTQLLVLLWLVTATALAQVVGWALEWVRRGPHGTWAARGLAVASGLTGAYLVAADRLVPLLQESPTLQVSIAALQGRQGITTLYVQTFVVLVAVAAASVVAGAALASAVSRRPARDELKLETSTYQPRSHPGSDLVAMLRTDRVGIWRSVPLRRGLVVLALMPGLVAIAGGLEWEMLPILPGLVASGGALLFGVNAWCLDGRGALWRDSLPVEPRLVFVSRVLVLCEVLLVASAATLVMATLRAGLPTLDQLAAVVAAALVVVLQVVSASLRWSVSRPFGVDLRSARATPAPPLVMVGYSARLALSTTLVGMFFSVLVRVSWEWSVLVAVPFLLLSTWRLVRTGHAWTTPEVRARVVATVAA